MYNINSNNVKRIVTLLVNVFLVILIFGCAELARRVSLCKKFDRPVKQYIFNIKSMPVDEYFTKLLNHEKVKNSFTNAYRPDIITNSIELPILFMGCSFTWGDNLDEKNTVSAKTSQLTGRSVYNRGGNAWGLDQLLYQLRRNDFYNNIEEPEYLIYVFIAHHIVRLDKFKNRAWSGEFQPHYELENGVLIEKKPHFWDESWIIEEYNYGKKYRYPYKDADEEFDRIKPYFVQSKDAMRKHWKNTKFVILKYPINQWINYNDKPLLTSKRWKELEDEGFIIVNISDLSKEPFWENKWRVDGWHPNSKAWDLLLPKILHSLNINSHIT